MKLYIFQQSSRVCIDNYPWKLIKFLCNGKKIHPFLTINENGIKDGSVIKCSFAFNIVFNNTNGSFTNITMDEDYPIKKAIKFYLLRIGKEGCFNEFIFYFNGKMLNIEDKTPIKNIFRNYSGSVRILVNTRL